MVPQPSIVSDLPVGYNHVTFGHHFVHTAISISLILHWTLSVGPGFGVMINQPVDL
ncbi:hypothetical protein CPB83DRAFT_852023 [Crepidotus variabilis]|uniref:Uncharacterized protein n=1 Tax=Crepidotus variabilis TaxID=179855 RepID=A0A9P6EHF6_9AGAR|nr:hypothetical protein CPB83DRAFT_852023 [Crepidotus variabilis]